MELGVRSYRKKPCVIEAVLWNGTIQHANAIYEWMGKPRKYKRVIVNICVETDTGPVYAEPGDWILKGVRGEFYPCKPDIFEKTYEEVS